MAFVNLPSIKQLLDHSSTGFAGKLRQASTLALVNRLVGWRLPFAGRNHFRVLALQPGYLKATIPLKPNRNHINTLYAGALFTLAELPGGILALVNFDSTFYPILKSLTMSYLKTAKSDVTVEFWLDDAEVTRIQKEATKNGKCDFVLKGELKDKQGQIVATSEGHYQIRAVKS